MMVDFERHFRDMNWMTLIDFGMLNTLFDYIFFRIVCFVSN